MARVEHAARATFEHGLTREQKHKALGCFCSGQLMTKTQKHSLSGDTVSLALTLKRLAARPNPNRLRDWMIEQIETELRWRASVAMATVR